MRGECETRADEFRKSATLKAETLMEKSKVNNSNSIIEYMLYLLGIGTTFVSE